MCRQYLKLKRHRKVGVRKVESVEKYLEKIPNPGEERLMPKVIGGGLFDYIQPSLRHSKIPSSIA